MWVSSILYIIIVKFLIFIKVDLMRILMYNTRLPSKYYEISDVLNFEQTI